MNTRPESMTARTDTALAKAEMGSAIARSEAAPIIPQNAQEVGDFCKAMIAFDAIPLTYQSMPENKRLGNMVVAVMKGLELGWPPLRALQSIYVVNGIPTVYGDGVMALMHHSGKVKTWREWYEGEGDQRVAYVASERVGVAGEMVRSFGLANAAAQGLLGKKGPWQHSRDRMMMIRARTYVARDLYADALEGFAIREEQEDIAVSTGIASIATQGSTAAIDPLADAEEAEFTETSAQADQDGRAEGNSADGPSLPAEPPVTEVSAAGVTPGQPGDAGGARTTSPAIFERPNWNGFVWDPADPELIGLPLAFDDMDADDLRGFGKLMRLLLEQSPTAACAEKWIDVNGDTLLRIAAKSAALAAWIREPMKRFAADQTSAATGGAPVGGQTAGAPPTSQEDAG